MFRETLSPLSDRLSIPCTFNKENAEGVSKEFESVLRETEKSLIYAPLKAIRRSPYGWLLILKHLPGLRFWVTDKVGSSAESMSHGPFRMDSFHGYALCLLEVRWGNTAGSFTVVALSVRTTDISFMRCSSESAATVASQLRAEGHSFVHPLHFDAPDDIALADYAFLDGVMTPIFVLSSSGNAVQDAEKTIPCWIA